MKALFFEDPFWLYGLLVLTEGVLVVVWYRRRERRDALRLLIPPALAALIFAVATLVVTDRERILQATDKIVGHLSTGRINDLAPYLDDEFHATLLGKSMDRPQALELARKAVSQHGLSKVTLKKVSVEVKGSEAHMRALTLIELRSSLAQGQLPVVWRLRWIKRGRTWLILEVSEPQVGATW